MTFPIQSVGIDHIVLISGNVERSLSFYCDTLHLSPIRVEEWRAGTASFPSVRVSPETIIDLIGGTPDGQNFDHFCIVIEPTDFQTLINDAVIAPERGPVQLFGARGVGTSVYVRDPDNNLVELRYYDSSSQ